MELKTDSIFQEDKAFLNFISKLEEGKTKWELVTAQKDMVFDAKFCFLENGNVQIKFTAPSEKFNDFDKNRLRVDPSLLVEPSGVKLLFLWTNLVDLSVSINKDKPVIVSIEYSAFQTDSDLKGISSLCEPLKCHPHWKSGKYATYLFADKDKAVSMHKSGIELLITTELNQNSSFKNLISFELLGMQFCFYELNVTGDKLLFELKSQKVLSSDEFSKVRDAVVAAYALITGTFLGSSGYLC